MAISNINKTQSSKRNHRIKARIIAPVKGKLEKASWLSVGAGAIWPLQAVAISWAISKWVTLQKAENPVWQNDILQSALIGGGLFVLLGLVRSVLENSAAKLLFQAADETIARERSALIWKEGRDKSPTSSAAIAALMVQKLPLLHPWITRYYVAMKRAYVLPLFLLVLAFSQSWAVGIVFLIAGPLIPVFMALIGMAAEESSRQQMNEIGSLNALTMERLSAMLDIRLLGATNRVIADFAKRALMLHQRTMAVLRIAFLSSTVLELFAAIGVALVAVFVGFSLLGEITFGTWGAPLTIGQGVFLLLLAPEFFQPLRDLAAAWHDRAAGFSVVDELEEVDGQKRISFLGEARRATPLGGAFSLETQKAAVTLDKTATIHIPDFLIKKGDSIAITGPSGAGKSTSLSALLGLIPLTQGEIKTCGQVLSSSTADGWRARSSYIPQRPHFADMTIREWIDPRKTGHDITLALNIAKARHIIERLPLGLDTRLGETGGGVSGGEARRLMVARAIIMGGDVIFADEPTANLDPETAAKVIDALLALNQKGVALVIASHDPALIGAMKYQYAVSSHQEHHKKAVTL